MAAPRRRDPSLVAPDTHGAVPGAFAFQVPSDARCRLIPLRNASTLPLSISNAWIRTPGPLVGIATGVVSNLWVVEVGPNGSDWWDVHHHQLPTTRTYENPSAGLQLFFTHGHGIPSTRGRLHKGVDTHSDGSHVVFWFAAGFECLDHETPQQFPDWLRAALTEPAP